MLPDRVDPPSSVLLKKPLVLALETDLRLCLELSSCLDVIIRALESYILSECVAETAEDLASPLAALVFLKDSMCQTLSNSYVNLILARRSVSS